MFVGARVLHDSRDVHPALVREGAAAHVWRAVVGIEVGHFVREAGEIDEIVELIGPDALDVHFEL